MDKKERKLNQHRIAKVRQWAKEVQPFKADVKWIQHYYMTNLAMMTPLQAANHVLQMSDAKLLKLYFNIVQRCGIGDLGGWRFDVKFLFVLHAVEKDIDQEYWFMHYQRWLKENEPKVNPV